MATHKSAEKRARQTVCRTERNTRLKSRIKSAVKTFRDTLTANDQATATAALATVTRELQKAGSKGIFHRRTVSRRVSRLAAAHHAKFAQA